MKLPCFLIIISIILLIGCSASRTSELRDTASSVRADQIDAHKKIIRRITDEILLALATRQYSRLETFIELGQPRVPDARVIKTGRHLARQLLGNNFHSIIMEQWNAQNISVEFDEGINRATARIAVTTRTKPNRRPRTNIITFRFHRLTNQQKWLLFLP